MGGGGAYWKEHAKSDHLKLFALLIEMGLIRCSDFSMPGTLYQVVPDQKERKIPDFP